jgi:glycosyltransferase involved in cell wall biosynthesis
MAKKKVLIIAYYFPPLGGAGVQRALKFVKYLPEFGWEPVVLTVKKISYPAWDETILQEIPSGAKIWRSGSLDPQRLVYLFSKFNSLKPGKQKSGSGSLPADWLRFLKWFSIPDSKIGWFPLALWKGLRLVRKENIDLIFSTSPPVTAHLVGYWVSKLSKKPLVMDFRDPWDLVAQDYPSTLHKRVSQALKRRILDSSKGFTAVNRQIADELLQESPGLKSEIISNGFDSADFEGLNPKVSDKFEIVYLGTFNRLNDPNPFLRAFSELIQTNETFAQKASFAKVGLVLDWDWSALLKQYNLHNNVVSIDYLPHRESLEYLLRAKVLLLATGGKTDSPLLSTSKIFEYLAARKPILAIVSENGAAAQLLRENDIGVIVEPNDKDGIKRALLGWFEKYKAGILETGLPTPDLKRYERKYLTRRLADFFNRCLDER